MRDFCFFDMQPMQNTTSLPYRPVLEDTAFSLLPQKHIFHRWVEIELLLCSPVGRRDFVEARAGHGLIGYGIDSYKPTCAFACNSVIGIATLNGRHSRLRGKLECFDCVRSGRRQ
ncbi:hypothetical protein BJ742DRAFT_42794 [Cladochytrium replicatum]|nr:hypothetical protein BJ742DRAFT_42794 [Cladochytrium replicatum]